jgi:hypothetical protein
MKRVLALLMLLFYAPGVHAAETSPFVFVSEYVRELGANEAARAAGERELAEKGANQFATAIRSSTRITLELRAQVAVLNAMKLDGELAELPDNIAEFYRMKIAEHARLIEISEAILAGPKPGVDYGKLASEAPKLTAELEFIDQSLFKATPLIFAALIRNTPDKNGHMSRLVITTSERDRLLQNLKSSLVTSSTLTTRTTW